MSPRLLSRESKTNASYDLRPGPAAPIWPPRQLHAARCVPEALMPMSDRSGAVWGGEPIEPVGGDCRVGDDDNAVRLAGGKVGQFLPGTAVERA